MGVPSLYEQLDVPLEEARRAVIDIGSNSVRLVLFNGPARSPLPILNEKSLCGLGRDMTDDGNLNPKASEEALRVIRRFAALLQAHGNPPTDVIATAAVRDARDGDQFVAAVEAMGFSINLLSGKREAELAASGVLSLKPAAHGFVGDLGGGSLELTGLSKGKIGGMGSLKIGPFQLMKQADNSLRAANSVVKKALGKADWLDEAPTDIFYAVGGAWRTIARMHMALREYPLSVLHHYTMSADDVIKLCALIEKQSRQSLQDMEGISRRRLDTLPYAALVLRRIVQAFKVKSIVISAGGVREGVMYSGLSKKVQALDPVVAFARVLARRYVPTPALGEAIIPIIAEVFPAADDNHRRLQIMICLLMDMAAYAHPTHRGRQAFDMALGLPIVGLTHEDRIMAGLALYRRYQGRSAKAPDAAAVRLLSQTQTDWAETLGLSIRFLADFSPKSPLPLEGCALKKTASQIIFSTPADKAVLMGELPMKRLSSLATRLDVKPVVKTLKT
ncbi:MAG: Ppx/GppA family phosphatase [Pseudomonadota bacterium]